MLYLKRIMRYWNCRKILSIFESVVFLVTFWFELLSLLYTHARSVKHTIFENKNRWDSFLCQSGCLCNVCCVHTQITCCRNYRLQTSVMIVLILCKEILKIHVTPWGRVIFERLTGLQLVKFEHFMKHEGLW